MFCSEQLEAASKPEIVNTEHGTFEWFGSAASQAKKPVPELVMMRPPFPTFGIKTELLIKFREEYWGKFRFTSQ